MLQDHCPDKVPHNHSLCLLGVSQDQTGMSIERWIGMLIWYDHLVTLNHCLLSLFRLIGRTIPLAGEAHRA